MGKSFAKIYQTHVLVRASLIGILTLSVLGCEGKKIVKESPLGDASQFSEVLTGYQLSDRNCFSLGDNQRTRVATLYYRVWDGSRVNTYRLADPSLDTRTSLAGGVVAETLMNVHQSVACTGPNRNEGCSDESQTISKPILLPICQDSFLYPRQSYEGVAVSSFANLMWIDKYYKSIESRDLPKVSLVVLPALEKRYSVPGSQERREFQFDNLSFVDSFIDKPAFVIYPTSVSRQPGDNGTALNLWESSWTMAHEFGHLVLASVSGVQKSALLLHSQHALSRPVTAKAPSEFSSLKFFSLLNSPFLKSLSMGDPTGSPMTEWNHFFSNRPSSSSYPKSSPKSNLGTRELSASFLLNYSGNQNRVVSNQEIWSAVNEGFADLFATAASNGNALTQGVPCIAVSRNTDQPRFQTGETKTMNSFALSSFVASQPTAQGSNCAAPDYQSPHTMGAIIAYGIRQLSLSYGQDSTALGKTLLIWAGRMGDLVRQGGGLQMSSLVLEGVKSFSSQTGPAVLGTNQCQILYSVFPDWFREWQQSSQIYCR